VTRAELLPSGEDTEAHRKSHKEEADAIEQGKARSVSTSRGLFGFSRHATPRRIAVIRDDEDGVERCPQCTWEIQDGWCESCGYAVMDDGSGYSDSLSELYDDSLGDRALEEMDMYGLADDYIDDEIFGDHFTEDERDSYSTYDDHRAGVPEAALRARARHATRRAQGQPTDRAQPLPPSHATYEPIRHRSPYSDEGMDDEERDSDTEQYGSEADEGGSMDDFIEDDANGRPQSSTDSVASHSDAQNFAEQGSRGQDINSSDARFSPSHSDLNSNSDAGETYDAEQDDSDQEIDQGFVDRHRSRRQYRRVVSDDENSSSGSSVAQRYNNRTAPPHLTCDSNNTERVNSHGATSQLAPIEIASDSDSVPVPRVRRRRAIVDDETSNDDDTPTQSHYSQSSGTLRQRTPTTDLPNPQLQTRRNRPSSAIVIDSSPVRTDYGANQAVSNFDGENSLEMYPNRPVHSRYLGRVQRSIPDSSVHSESSDGEIPRLDSETPPPSKHNNQLTVPRPLSYHSNSRRSRTSSSPGSLLSAHSVSPNTRRRVAQVEERAPFKGERRSRKQERRRRDQARSIAEPSGRSAPDASTRRNDAFGRRWD